MGEKNGQPIVGVNVGRRDLASALEIAQAHGGELADAADSGEETATNRMFDPSGDDYDRFEAGVRV